MNETLHYEPRRQAPKSADERLVALDAARFLAAIAIIWQHTPESPQLKPYSSLAAFAVPFFIAASILMTVESVRRKPDRPFAGYVIARFTRVYVPFLIWTAIYLLIRNLKHAALSGQPRVPISAGILIGGSAHHLWFLPFVFVVSLIVFALAKVMREHTAVEWLTFAIALVGGTIVALMPDDLFRDQYVLDRAWAATPAVLWGIALAAIYRRIPRRVWQSAVTPIIGAIVLLACLPLMVIHWHSHLTENLAGMGVVVIALHEWRAIVVQRLAGLASLAYGVYLSHVMFIEGMQAVAARVGLSQLWWLDLLVFAFATIAALFFTRAVSRWRLGRWIAPG